MREEVAVENHQSHQFKIEYLIGFCFYMMIGCSLIRVIPYYVTDLFKYSFILMSMLYFVSSKKMNIKLHGDRVLFGYILYSLFSVFYSPYSSFPMVLAWLQFALINGIIIFLPSEIFTDSFIKFMNIIERVMVVAVIYSFILKTFGVTRMADGFRLNYIFNPLFGQYAHGFENLGLGYSSFFSNPNPFGAFCLFALVWKVFSTVKLKVSDFILLIIYCFGIYLSKSRAAYVGLVIAIIMYIFFMVRRKELRNLLLSIITIFIVIICALNWSYILSFIYNVDLAGRRSAWDLLISSIINHPVFGTGFSSASKYIVSSVSNGTYSSYLTIIADTGMVGFVFVAAYIILTIMAFIQNIDTHKFYKATLCLAIIIVAMGISENILFNITERWLILLVSTRLLCEYTEEGINSYESEEKIRSYYLNCHY